MNDYARKLIIAKKCIAPIIRETAQTKQSGIYLFERTDENDVTFFYCGQARNIFQRIVSHWNGYQRIDLSIRKRKFKSEDNPHGWSFSVVEYCPIEKLDEREQYWILELIRQGKQTYNVTYGSQGNGKQNIKDGKTPKGYWDGVAHGEKRLARELKRIADLHLEIRPRKNTKTCLNALEKFFRLIGGKNDG